MHFDFGPTSRTLNPIVQYFATEFALNQGALWDMHKWGIELVWMKNIAGMDTFCHGHIHKSKVNILYMIL